MKPQIITLCPACEKLFQDSFVLRKLKLNEVKDPKVTCEHCGHRVALMDTFEVMRPNKGRHG